MYTCVESNHLRSIYFTIHNYELEFDHIPSLNQNSRCLHQEHKFYVAEQESIDVEADKFLKKQVI